VIAGNPSGTSRQIGRLYVALGALREGNEWAFWLGVIVWWIDELQLSPLQLMMMGVVLSLTVLLTETPTGVVADMYSRKWSMALGMALMGGGFVWAVISRNYWVILPAQVLFGVGWTFTSGADIAWLTDELRGSLDPDEEPTELDHRVEQLLLRRHRWGMLVGATGIIFMMFFGRQHLRAAIVATGCFALAVAAAWVVLAPERHFNRSAERSTFRSTLNAGLANVRRRPRLQSLLAMALLTSLGAEALDRFGYVRFIEAIGIEDESIVDTGLLFLMMAAAGMTLNLVVSSYIDRRDRSADTDGDHNPMVAPAIIATCIAGVGALLAGGGAGLFVIGFGLMLQDSTRETLFELMNAWTNREVESSARATVHSLIGQAFAVGEIVGGLLLGVIAEIIGIPLSLYIAGALLFVAATVALPALRSSEQATATAG